MVVLAASICTRGGKAVLSRQFREMPRSRIEALLASFPKLADSGTQHTTVEQDNVRFVYQPLDELYMVLITNRQSNILQDIDSLHLFAQVVTSTCKNLDEREILKNAYELLSAFDELVTLGYRENLTISQIKTFLDMESHEERIQEIIARNKELEATEERKRKAKQLEMQRKDAARSGRGAMGGMGGMGSSGGMPRSPSYPSYNPPSQSNTSTYDSYEAEKNKSFSKPLAPKAKGMQLGKKSKTTDMFERVRGDMGGEIDDSPLVAPAPVQHAEAAEPRVSSTLDRDAIHVTISETISAKLSREGAVNSLAISGDLVLRISDPSLTKIKLGLQAEASHGVQFRTHPNVDRNLFNGSKIIQMSNTARGFPVNNAVGVLRWRASPKVDDASTCPITFTVWINKEGAKYNITVEYELTGSDALNDVSVVIPYAGSEPVVSSFDATYDVSGDALEWTIGNVDEENPNGSFEFEAESGDENDFFPMTVRFNKSTPYIDVDVLSASLLEEEEEVTFSKEIKSHADNFLRNQLAPFSATEYQDRAPDGYPVSCPTLDLSATWDPVDKNILVYRPPGQVVSKIHQVGAPGQKAPDAQAVTWRSDGQFLAVGWSDGFVRLIGLENNKAAHHIKVGESPGSNITHIGWASSSIAGKGSSAVSQALRDGLVGDSARNGDGLPLNLPRELTFLEVDTALPKISPLPSSSAGSGEDALVFTLRTGIDFLFQPPKPEEYDQVSVMIIGTSDGQLQLSIYDSFIIGSFQCPQINTSSSQLILHASHPHVSTQALLVADKTEEPEEVHLVPIDLPFISSHPINLSLLASKLTTLQKLLRYLKQAQLHMQVEWRNTRELPTRFLRSIQGDLENLETGPRSIVPALYHLAVTGHAFEPVREWLVESLAERGHKRWDKAVVSGLEGLRNLVHENFLPALDRCAIILSRLRGLAQFHDTRDDIGFTLQQTSRLMDIVQCLQLIGHKVLINVMDELDSFTAFSTWLRFQIDRLASSSSASEELTEKEATMDIAKVLSYIGNYLIDSPLRLFFDEMTREDYEADWAHIEGGPTLLHVLDQALGKWENGQSSMKALPRIEFLVSYATTWANRTFKGIAEAKKRSVRLGNPIRLSAGRVVSHRDMRMSKSRNKETNVVTALASKEAKSEVQIFSVGIDIINGISTNRPPKGCRIDLGPRTLIDLKFLNDETLVILSNSQDNGLQVVSVPIRTGRLAYADYDPSRLSETPCVSVDGFTAYSFPEKSVSRPLRMEVNDRNNVRGDMPQRVCVVESNRTTIKTFTFQ
ncbi:unnamed protein product [Fusarium fujikuroi]|uniref:Coatomer subunit delta n=1 Tax=Fusarium fujikuroi TaxID=5127 RepID=A0A9Q9UCY4_FUSFU|nr:unnamed protein product [Fusarium fujikuroi]